jgi:hypothetical protein
MSKLTIDFNNTSLPIIFKNVPSQHFEWPQSTFTQKKGKMQDFEALGTSLVRNWKHCPHMPLWQKYNHTLSHSQG